mmetsp:Transcript_50245/g.129513  ORF Transcript_50245/g.129513 Transcript_50245/m.129513 type:complete len:222 (-) Transcript_50245:49-714(-)
MRLTGLAAARGRVRLGGGIAQATWRAVALASATVAAVPERKHRAAQQLGPVPAWADAALVAAAICLCGIAQPYVGNDAAGWGAVTVCVVTGLQTDFSGKPAHFKAALRLLGTLLGVATAVATGGTWWGMAVWCASMVFVKRWISPFDGYACIVGAFTYAIVGLGQASQAAVYARGLTRIAGVILGGTAVSLCLVLRWTLARALRGAARRSAKQPAEVVAAS